MSTAPGEFDPSLYIPQPRVSYRPPAEEPLLNDLGEPLVHPRQPHLGYSLAVLLIGFIATVATLVVLMAVGTLTHLLPPLTHLKTSPAMPKVSILAEAIAYAITFLLSVVTFERMWRRRFTAVLQIRVEVARRYVGRLVLLGAVLSIAAQFAETRLTLPRQMPIDAFFTKPLDVWLVALFGTFVAPAAEELLFRGFLLRSVAIAYDWMRTRFSDAGRLEWATTDGLSRAALIFSGILTSVLFAVTHAAQLGFAWNAVALLSVVGGVLTVVRVRLGSVAASTVVHMAYNGFIFTVLFIATEGFRHLDKLTK